MVPLMDWLEEFMKRFGPHESLKHLKKAQFHGKLELNFRGGIVENVKKAETFLPAAGATTKSHIGEA